MSTNDGPENQQSPDSANGPTNNDVRDALVAELRSFKEQQHTDNEANKTTEDRRHFWNVATTIGVLIYTFLTLGIVATSIYQLRQSERDARQQHNDTLDALKKADVANGIAQNAAAGQLSAMQSQITEMQSEQRAWVSLTKDSGIESLFVNAANELRATIRIGLQNTGKNPAVSVFVNADMSIGAVMPHGSMAAWQAAVCGRPTGLGFTMFPGSPEPIYEVETGTTAAEFAERKRMSLVPVVAACIVYEDAVTRQTHYTPLAFQVLMRAPRPGNSCCAILPDNLPINGGKLLLREWIRGNLPPS